MTAKIFSHELTPYVTNSFSFQQLSEVSDL